MTVNISFHKLPFSFFCPWQKYSDQLFIFYTCVACCFVSVMVRAVQQNVLVWCLLHWSLWCKTWYVCTFLLFSFSSPTQNPRLWWTAVSCSMSAGNPMLKRAELVPYRNEQYVRYKRSKWAQTKTSGWTPRHSFEKGNVIPHISSVVIFLIFSTAALAIIVGVNHDSQHFIPMQHPFLVVCSLI